MSNDDVSKPLLIKKLLARDRISNSFSELFYKVVPGEDDNAVNTVSLSTDQHLIDNLRIEVRAKDNELMALQERISVMTKNIERINDEIIGSSIENNVLQQKYDTLKEEYDKLIQRWLKKVQKEADKMNEHVERSDN